MAQVRNRFGGARLQRHHLILFALVSAALIVRVVFLNGRWIVPDEGAHLMDGRLVLDGFVPVVDFQSRQVFYTYMLAFLLRIVGVSYEAARVYPILATVGIGALVYLIAARLLDRRVGLLAAAIYLFLPLTITYGTVVKTEPLTILLSCLGLYALLVALDRNRSLVLFVLAGLCFGLAYYVRQSSLALLLASVVILVVVFRRPWPALRASVAVFGGFVAICVGVLVLYSTMLPISQTLTEQSLNPAAFVLKTVQPAWQMLAGAGPAVEATAQTGSPEAGESVLGRLRRDSQTVSTTIRNIREVTYSYSFMIVALFLSPLFLLRRRSAPEQRPQEEDLRAASVLYAWVGAVALAYALYALVRGFFPAYFGELLPPLAILTAVVALDALRRFRAARAPTRRDLTVLAVLVLAVVTQHVALPWGFNRPLYYLAVPPIFALIYLGGSVQRRHWAAFGVLAAAAAAVLLLDGVVRGMVPSLLYLAVLFFLVFGALFAAWRVDPRKQPGLAVAFVSYSLLVSTALVSLGPPRTRIDRAQGTWSPETVAEVVTYLEQHTEPADEVISGAAIWEFQANRRPFMLISHPLAYSARMPPDVRSAIEERLRERPPAVVILDGYTERTYVQRVPLLSEVLSTRYRLDRVVEDARYPVQIYRLDTPLSSAR